MSNFRPDFLGETSKWQKEMEKTVNELSRKVLEQNVDIRQLRKEISLLQRKA